MPENTDSHSDSGGQEELLSLDEAIKFLDTSKSTLYRLLNQGDLKGVRVGKQWRFRTADLTSYIERSPGLAAISAGSLIDVESELQHFTEELARIVGPVISDTPQLDSVEAKMARLVHTILDLAIACRSSDVHCSPIAGGARIRFRVDGVLQDVRRLPAPIHASLLARLKEMAEMNVLEKRLPQDGRALFQSAGEEFELRISTIPAIHGESGVVRILNRSAAIVPLAKLAAKSGELDLLSAWMQRSRGMVITTAPTGSGKTTLLYSCLMEIDSLARNVATVEDPVEIALPGITQMQVNRRIGLGFAAGMSNLLRHDPDVIMCGEFRDLETAERALEASVTGHLVLAALHTEDAPGALQRLVDIGLAPFLVCEELIGVVAMRLPRRLCSACKRSAGTDRLNREAVRRLAAAGGYALPAAAVFHEPVGCKACRNTGYRGRIPIFEILECNPPLVRTLLACKSKEERSRQAVEAGMRTLAADGIMKAAAGETSVEEVLRVAGMVL